MGRKVKETRKLECVLKDSEKLVYSKELSDTFREKDAEEESLKSYSTQAKAAIQGCVEKMKLLSLKLSSGKEYRDVVCAVAYDWEKGTRTYIREDTGEIVDTDIIPETDIQEHMNLERVGGPEKTEAEVVASEPLQLPEQKQLPAPGSEESQE
jgi:hypothetical protein